MRRSNRRLKQNPRQKVAPADFAGMASVWRAGITPAAAPGSTADVPPSNAEWPQQVTLGDEEITDISLSTFPAFDS